MMLRHRFASMNPAFLPALTLPAPERIHAEGGLGHWAEAAHIPSDPRAPEAPNLTTPGYRTAPLGGFLLPLPNTADARPFLPCRCTGRFRQQSDDRRTNEIREGF